MCGIAGIISNAQQPIAINHFKKMTEALAHRGPDGEGLWHNENNTVLLGHTRLAIIDLSHNAAQPMQYLNRYVIVHNGEIYNYIELKKTLQTKGYSFTTASDTEIILAAYDYWEADCVTHFEGMFAFAIWDKKEEQLFAARDRFGEKPFYFFEDQNYFLFASEMKALWAVGVPKAVEPKMLLNYLSLGHVQNAAAKEQTFFTNIYSLPPAHFFLYQPSQKKRVLKKYWDLDKNIKINISANDAIEKFNELFAASIKKRLRSDVAIGTSLSGGIDSASIAAAIQQCQPEKTGFKTFSAIFPNFEKDESYFINLISHVHQLPNFTTSPSAEGLIKNFETLCYHQEEPFCSTSIYAQYKVFNLAHQHKVKVLLDGQGADEILAGYPKYIHWFLQEKITQYNFLGWIKQKKLLQNNQVKFSWGIKNYFAALLPIHASMILEKKEFSKIVRQPDIHPQFLKLQTGREWEGINKPVVSQLNDILHFNTTELGLEELLRYSDRNSMAQGIEVRLPFLDHQLVEYIFSLPSSLKINEGFTKWVLRKAMNKKLPNEIVWRKDKIGYEPPQQQWMHNKTLQDYIYAAKKKLVTEKILNPNVLNKKINPKEAHAADNFDWRYLCAAQII